MQQSTAAGLVLPVDQAAPYRPAGYSRFLAWVEQCAKRQCSGLPGGVQGEVSRRDPFGDDARMFAGTGAHNNCLDNCCSAD